MQSESNTQTTFSESKDREIAEAYLNIQQNTEMLSHLVRYNRKIKRSQLKFQAPVDVRSFLTMQVQVTYLLYTCHLRATNMLMSTQIFSRPPKRGQFIHLQEAYCVYMLEVQYNKMSNQQKTLINQSFQSIEITRSPASYQQFFCQFILKIRNILRPHLQLMKGTHQGMVLVKQVESLGDMVENYLMPQLHSLAPKTFILCLQETEVFREHSSLVKCLNNSLFAALRFHPQTSRIYTSLITIQRKLLKSKREPAYSIEHIEEILQQCVQMLIKFNILFSGQSLNANSLIEQQGVINRKLIIGSVQGATRQTRKYSIRIQVSQKPFKPFNKMLLQKIQESCKLGTYIQSDMDKIKDDKCPKNEYLIEFQHGSGVMSIRYVTNIQLTIQNTDLLMFHCNYLSHSWNTITLEFFQRNPINSKQKRKERLLSFRTISYINPNQSIIFKIFLMIDLLMVYAKIVQPQLKKNIANLEEYYKKIDQLNHQVEHLNRIFIKKVEKNYQALQEEK